MKTIKTSEATELQLDWLVAKCEFGGADEWRDDFDFNLDVVTDLEALGGRFSPTTDWVQGGPIIEREEIGFAKYGPNGTWKAVIGETPRGIPCYGPTPLIAALRCFVASRLGDEVDVPSELLK